MLSEGFPPCFWIKWYIEWFYEEIVLWFFDLFFNNLRIFNIVRVLGSFDSESNIEFWNLLKGLVFDWKPCYKILDLEFLHTSLELPKIWWTCHVSTSYRCIGSRVKHVRDQFLVYIQLWVEFVSMLKYMSLQVCFIHMSRSNELNLLLDDTHL